jgi:hypothetical protein
MLLGYLLLFGIVNEVPQLKSPWTVLYRLPPNVIYVNNFRRTAKVHKCQVRYKCFNSAVPDLIICLCSILSFFIQ